MKKLQDYINESNEKPDERFELNVKFSNLTEEQLLELHKLLEVMEYSGDVGSSRDFKVGLDGDGSFRVEIEKDQEVDKKDEEKIKKAVDDFVNDKLFISFL